MKGGDAFAAWGGISGCQTLLPALLTHGGVGVEEAARLTATAPAERFRLAGKGRIEPGADADLALVALGEEWTLAAADLRYRHPHSPYVGRGFTGRVVETLLRGGATRGRLVTPLPTA